MIVIFSDFSLETQQQDVLNFLEPAVKISDLFDLQEDGMVNNIKFFTLLNENLEPVELKVLITIESDPIALDVIKKLDNCLHEGKAISVRQYHQRLENNDRRSSLQNSGVADEQRVANRRRKNLYEIVD